MRFFYVKYFFLLTTLLAFAVASPIYGQEQISEEEVNTQKIFIDANKEKILGNYENAVYLFKEVLKRDKKNHAALYELARIYDVQEKNDKALHSIKEALSIDSENVWYEMFLADLHDKMGKPKEAAKIYETLVSQDDENTYYYEKWAFHLVKAGEAEKAIKVYDKLEDKFGVNEELSGKKYRLYLGLGNQKKAAEELEMLVKSAPSNTDHKHMLASFYLQIGDQKKAEEIYKEILKIDPDDAYASIALAERLKDGGDDISFLNTLKPVFENLEVNIDVKIKELIPYIHKLANSGDEVLGKKIIELAEILQEVHPNEAKSYSAFGDILYYSGDNQAALGKYQKALELNKSVFTVWEQVMYINMELRNFEDLLKTSDEAIDFFPNHAKAYYFNGVANGQLKNHKDAINSLQQALIMSRKNPTLRLDIYNHMAIEYYQLEDFDKSDTAFEEALKINPKAHSILNRYSHYLAMRGVDLAKAKEMCAKANELNPNNPYYQDTYGWILYKIKEYSAAKEWVVKAMANGGNEMPIILEHYGDILFQLDEVENAIANWQKALDKGSKSKMLEKKIADRQLYE
jgi:tetratricopeptide (TPR) repeat protein